MKLIALIILVNPLSIIRKRRSIIVKFRSWEPRAIFYKARPRNHLDWQNNSEFDVTQGDFNARSSSWWPKDINATEGSNLFSLFSSSWFSQLIKEPIYIQISSSSYIDLIFTVQPNLSLNSGVHASWHQIVITKLFTLALILMFPTPHHINN